MAEDSGGSRRTGRSIDREKSGPLSVLLGNKSLTRIVAAFACVTLGEWGYVTALSVDAFRKDGAIAVGFVGLRIFFAAASSFLSPLYLPRRSGSRILSEVALLRTVAIGTSAVIAGLGAPLAPLLVILGLDAIVSAQYRPGQSAIIPTLARSPKELVATATELSTVKTLSQAFGSVAGAALLVVVSPSAVFGGVAVVFFVAGTVTFRFRLADRTKRGGQSADMQQIGIRRLMRETRQVIEDRFVAGILVVSGLRTFVRGMWVAIAVIASIKLLHGGSAGVGLLMLAAGIGSLVAAPLSSMLVTRPRLGTPAALALVACGVPLALIAGVPELDLALALVAAWGIGMALTDVATSSLLHRLLDTPAIPRATGTIESAKLALEGLGGFVAPLLASTVGIRPTLFVAAIPLPLVVISGWRTLHKADETAGERAATLELLHGAHCLQPLDMPTLDSLVGRVEKLEVRHDGVEVVRQGEPGDAFYVVETGTADVLVDGFTVGILGPGSSFGERALLRDVPRTATVRSSEAMTLLVLSREDFLAAITGQQDVELGTEVSVSSIGAHEWSRRERAELLSRLNLFSHLDSKALDALADRSLLEDWAENSEIVKQGETGDRYFVMLEGDAAVSIDSITVNKLCAGDQFGEIALLHGVPRSATVVATTPVRTLSLGRDDFLPSVRSQVLSG